MNFKTICLCSIFLLAPKEAHLQDAIGHRASSTASTSRLLNQADIMEKLEFLNETDRNGVLLLLDSLYRKEQESIRRKIRLVKTDDKE